MVAVAVAGWDQEAWVVELVIINSLELPWDRPVDCLMKRRAVAIWYVFHSYFTMYHGGEGQAEANT